MKQISEEDFRNEGNAAFFQNKAASAIMNIPVKIIASATNFFEYLSARCAINKQSIPLNTIHIPIDFLLIYICC